MNKAVNLIRVVALLSLLSFCIISCSKDDEAAAKPVVKNPIAKIFKNGELEAEFFYDDKGRCTGYEWAYGTITLNYSPNGKLSSRISDDGNGNTNETEHFYHSNGNLDYSLFYEGGNLSTKIVYTFTNGRISKYTFFTSTGVEQFKQTIEYTADSYIASTFSDPPTYANPAYTMTYQFYTDVNFQDPYAQVDNIEFYLPWGLRKAFQYSGTDINDLEYTYEFDDKDRVTTLLEVWPNDGGRTFEYTYEYVEN